MENERLKQENAMLQELILQKGESGLQARLMESEKQKNKLISGIAHLELSHNEETSKLKEELFKECFKVQQYESRIKAILDILRDRYAGEGLETRKLRLVNPPRTLTDTCGYVERMGVSVSLPSIDNVQMTVINKPLLTETASSSVSIISITKEIGCKNEKLEGEAQGLAETNDLAAEEAEASSDQGQPDLPSIKTCGDGNCGQVPCYSYREQWIKVLTSKEGTLAYAAADKKVSEKIARLTDKDNGRHLVVEVLNGGDQKPFEVLVHWAFVTADVNEVPIPTKTRPRAAKEDKGQTDSDLH